MLSPWFGGIVFGIPNFKPGNDYAYAMDLAASLMAGWVLLLIWADRKPVERKGVLLLTVFPVLVGLMLSGIYAVTSNLVAFDKMLPTWMMQGILVFLFGFSYLNAGKLDTSLGSSAAPVYVGSSLFGAVGKQFAAPGFALRLSPKSLADEQFSQ